MNGLRHIGKCKQAIQRYVRHWKVPRNKGHTDPNGLLDDKHASVRRRRRAHAPTHPLCLARKPPQKA
jgi:hypothetical protein